MIVAAMLSISLGMLFASSPVEYSEAIFSLIVNRVTGVAVTCWLWVGAFSGMLADSGLTEAIVWLGWKLNLEGSLFVLCTFIASAVFTVSVGSAFGTVVGFITVIYPAGILLGSPPGPLMGAIISGAAFGDNLAPVSDTTIISAATQETDIGGVVRSRLKYSLIAGIITSVLFFIHEDSALTIHTQDAYKLLSEIADPSGLPMLIPGIIVLLSMMFGCHFFLAINLGILSTLVIGSFTGAFPLERMIQFSEEGSVGGSMVDGILSILPIIILAMLLITINKLMECGGFFIRLLDLLERYVVKSMRGAEIAIVVLVSIANLCVPGNTTAMITIGPLVNNLRKRHGIHPYRSANLMDTISCSFPYMLPYSAIIILTIALQKELLIRYDFIVVLSWADIWPHVYYGIVLLPLMILAVITGFGRKKG